MGKVIDPESNFDELDEEEWFGGSAKNGTTPHASAESPEVVPLTSEEITTRPTDLDQWKTHVWLTMSGLLRDEPSFFWRDRLTIVLNIGEHLDTVPYLKAPVSLSKADAEKELDHLVDLFLEHEVGPEPPPKPLKKKREQFSPGAPDLIADAWVREVATTDDGITVRRWDGGWWIWLGTHSVRQSEEDQRAQVGRFLRSSIDLISVGSKGEKHLKHPNKALLENVMDALRSQLNLRSTVRPPIWIADDPNEVAPFDPRSTVAVENGLVTLSTGELHPASPKFFCVSALKTSYDPRAKCPGWGQFLSDVWEDRQSQDALQEMFGYLLTSDTRQQKAFMIVGPPRSGKGTIGRILAGLLGPDAVSRPALADFGSDFGLEPLIGKSLAIISDARLDGNVPSGVLAERLLAISGEDTINIARKYKDAFNGPLSVRFLLLTNELPRFRDASGALPNRFVMLRMNRTWLGKEDPTLFDRLATELPGILNWAMEGWMRLQERGHFTQPDAAREFAEQLASIANPLGVFIEEACELGPDKDSSIGELYRHYVDWSKRGEMRPMPVTVFGRDLRAGVPGLDFYRPHGQPRRIKGIEIKLWDGSGSMGTSDDDNQRSF